MKLVYRTAIIALSIMTSCGGGDDSTTPIVPPEVVADPKATTLIFPENNTECNEGAILSDLQSKVTFRWNPSEDTDSYEVNLKNLSTNQNTVKTISTQQIDITIDRGTPYEWSVVSKATGTAVTATSAKFKFYNEGPGIVNYAPFPAEAISPARGAEITGTSGTVTLEWNGSDIDNDIISYEVFFGIEEVPSQSIGTTSAETITTNIAIGTTYYWKIVTFDDGENTSHSEIFEFKVSS